MAVASISFTRNDLEDAKASERVVVGEIGGAWKHHNINNDNNINNNNISNNNNDMETLCCFFLFPVFSYLF